MEVFSDKMNNYLSNSYHRMLIKVFDHQALALSVGLITLVADRLFIHIPTDFVPNEDVGFFVIYTQEMEGGSSKRCWRMKIKFLNS